MDKEDLLKALLENQKRMTEVQASASKSIDDIEPFSWMDDETRKHLEAKLSEQEMCEFDKCMRANIVGRSVMTDAIKKMLGKPSQECTGQRFISCNEARQVLINQRQLVRDIWDYFDEKYINPISWLTQPHVDLDGISPSKYLDEVGDMEKVRALAISECSKSKSTHRITYND